MRRSTPVLVTAWKTAVDYLPPKFSVDHSADQYGMQANVNPPQYAETSDGLTRGLTPPAAEELYHPIQEPFLVPPKYRRMYNFSDGHGKYLYTKDPLWVEARERYWDDLQTASQVHRANYHHIRTKYRKQWHDANRYNLDEYLTTMNRVKHMEVVRREAEEETRQEQLQDDLARIDAISLLQQKRRNLRVDKFWKVNVWTHERMSEELQYLTKHKVNQDFLTNDNLDAMLEKEVSRWATGADRGKLNMFGRMPYLEDDNCMPLLEVQYQFMSEDLTEDGREAYRRLTQVAEQAQSGLARIEKTAATYVDFDFNDEDASLGESQIEGSSEGEPEPDDET